MQFEIYKSIWDGQWYWRFRAQNGRIICDGSEGYSRKWNVKRALRRAWRLLHVFAIPIMEVEEYET